MGNIHSKSTISVGLHLEVSCYISLAGFIVPISFMGYYHTVTPLYVILWLFVVLAFLLELSAYFIKEIYTCFQERLAEYFYMCGN